MKIDLEWTWLDKIIRKFSFREKALQKKPTEREYKPLLNKELHTLATSKMEKNMARVFLSAKLWTHSNVSLFKTNLSVFD